MYQQRALWLAAVVLVSCCLQARGADKYTDENRPYEFGFTIDGEQHRHEKKDENGLIMGEFGFITADGVYHVTVYATDENGNFKILSMKNLRVKPFPTAGGPQSRALELPGPKSGQPGPQAPAVPRRGLPGLPEPAPVKSCSGCSIPTSTTQPPKQLTDLAIVSRDNEQFPPYPEQPLNNRGRQLGPGQNHDSFGVQSNPLFGNEQGQPGFPPNNQFNGVTGGNNGLEGGINQQGQQAGQFSQQPGQFGQQPGLFGQQPGQFAQQPGQFGQQSDQPGSQGGQFSQLPGQFEQQPGQFGQQPGQFGQQPGQFGQQPGQFDQQPEQFGQGPGPFGQQPGQESRPSKPMLISAQMQIVGGNTDVNQLGPGERQGLPNGLHKDDMLQLLYTFNYTVGFHGHHEEGYTNGAKKGYYYVTGRNGVRTRIDYTADETGFHPKISNEVLDLLSDDVPKPESEKDEKYGLKGYEFKWLYYPPSSQK